MQRSVFAAAKDGHQLSQPFREVIFCASFERLWNVSREQDHSGLIPSTFTTLPHFSMSSEMIFPKAAGEPPSTVPPNSAIRVMIFGSVRPALISPLSLSMVSAGVSLGAPMPSQP